MTFHVSGSGGSGAYKFRMDAPSYSNPNEYAYESVADPSRGEWMLYTDECESYDYTFTMTASGTYNYRFYIMDKLSNVTYLRVNMYITVSDDNYPSVNSIVAAAVAECEEKTDGSEYEKALWLHDWLLQQLDYDKYLKWSSSESALTRGLGNYATRSTSLKNNYFVRSGEAQTWADAYVERIRKQLEDGQTAFSISADNASYPPSISAIQNGIIAYVLNQMKWSVNGENISLQAVGKEKEFTLTATKNSSITGEKPHSYTLNLDGTIAINLYMELPESLASNQEVYMEFTLPNGSVSQVKVKDAVKKDGYYVFTCRVAAKEMAADVKARMVADGQRGKEYTVSVERYAEYVLNHTAEYSATTIKLVKAMLNYGASAQTMFDYHTDKMANEILSEEDKKVGTADFSAYKQQIQMKKELAVMLVPCAWNQTQVLKIILY